MSHRIEKWSTCWIEIHAGLCRTKVFVKLRHKREYTVCRTSFLGFYSQKIRFCRATNWLSGGAWALCWQLEIHKTGKLWWWYRQARLRSECWNNWNLFIRFWEFHCGRRSVFPIIYWTSFQYFKINLDTRESFSNDLRRILSFSWTNVTKKLS